jgi:hypothetical protein
MMNSIIIQQTQAGEPINAGEMNIYPVARSYRIDFPAARGGIVWNRPLAVIVEDPHGSRKIIPIQDRTRQLQVAMLAAGFFGTLLTWLIFRRSR